MLFTSFTFLLVFLPLVLFVYRLSSKKMQKVSIIIFFTLIFYGLWDYRFLALLLGSVIFNYLWGMLINKNPSKKYIFVIGIIINLAPLIYFKYSNFFLGIIHSNFKIPAFVLPLAISFFTFEQIAYLVYVFRGNRAERNVLRYSFYILFFPHLIAGPIVYYEAIVSQIDQEKNEKELMLTGILFFFIGLVKKIVIADTLAKFVDPIYGLSTDLNIYQSIIATFGYTFQLYFDFSGYSDMAIGLAAMFGYKLPTNFNSPYKATSITDFWRRWHITLSTFLRDYIYIPLGGNRKGQFKRYRNLMITMLLGGLWHGAGWTFVIWGGIHGLLQCINQIWAKYFNRFKLGVLSYPLTFLCVALSWVIFRSPNMHQALKVYKGFTMLGEISVGKEMYLIALCFVIILLPNSQELVSILKNALKNIEDYIFSLSKRIAIYTGMSISIILCFCIAFYEYGSRVDQFIYRIIPIKTEIHYIDNKNGDYRSNLYINEIFQGNGKKVIFIGSSFTTLINSYKFTYNGDNYKIGTIGIGGNSIINALRGFGSVIDTPNLDTIVIGVSPLNMGKVVVSDPFIGQATGSINKAGFDFPINKFQECQGMNLNKQDIWNIARNFKDEQFFQLHGFLYNIYTRSFRRQNNFQVIDMNDIARNDFYKNLQDKIQSAKTTTKDLENGENLTFKWRERGILESMKKDGDIYKAFFNIKKLADERDIRLVIYDTPTANYIDGPQIYPEGFLEEYKACIKNMTDELDIDYTDLTGLFPWKGEFFGDFIHTTSETRQDICKYMIYKTFK